MIWAYDIIIWTVYFPTTSGASAVFYMWDFTYHSHINSHEGGVMSFDGRTGSWIFFARSPSFKLQLQYATDIDSEIEFWHQSGFAGCSRITFLE